MGERIDWWKRIARRKLGLPLFQWHTLRAVDWHAIETSDTLVVGGEPIGVYTKGKGKGRPKFGPRSTDRTCVVTDAELKAEQAAWEAETGHCARCCGSGEVFQSMSVTEGTKYRTCPKCLGAKTANRTPDTPSPQSSTHGIEDNG